MNDIRVVQRCLAVFVLVALVLAGCAGARRPSLADVSPAAGANPASRAASTNSPAISGIPIFLGTHYTSQGHTHLVTGEPDDFVYNSDPPSSGPHRELFTDTFISRKPLPSYIQVHLLEHGNVLLQYSCNCPAVAAELAQIAMQYDKLNVNSAEDQGKAVVVAPYPHMKSKIALSAWTHVGALPSVDKQKINSFISVHLGNPTE